MALSTLLLFTFTELALSLSPGSAVFLVISQGVRSGLGAITARVHGRR